MSILPRWLRGKKLPASDEMGPDALDPAVREKAQALVESANTAEDAGNLALALRRIREAVEIAPNYARAHLNLGNVLQAQGDLEGAMAATARAIALEKQYAEAHFNLGRLHVLKGESAAAEASYLQAMKLRPQFPAAATAMASLCESMKRLPEAESWQRRAVDHDPLQQDATFALCRMLLAQGKHDEMEQVLQRAVDVNPKFCEAYCNLGDLCRSQGRQSEAVEWYIKGLATGDAQESPESRVLIAKTTFVLATLLIKEHRWNEATKHFKHAMDLMPGSAAPHVNLAWMELRKARPKEAIALLERAVELDPDEWSPKSFRLFALNLLDDMDPQEIFVEHRRFGEWLEARVEKRKLSLSDRLDPERTLRVGYVSGDYRLHPVMQFLLPMLEDHDRERVQPFCYSNTLDPDEVTAEFQRRFGPIWRDIRALSDDEVADVIVDDEIDILVDLSGHTGNSRLSIFAQKPAPIQVAWIGYLNTTGLKAMDYRLVDRCTDPVGMVEELNTERLIRLPDSQWAYWPIFEVPIMRPERRREGEGVIFGSFNQFTKLNDRTLGLWGQILQVLPGTKIRVAGLPPGNFEEDLLRRLEKVGIAHDRVSVAERVPVMQYLQTFNGVDIALDTMPYNGATTTLDTLWMGIPVVGLVGDRSISRGTYSILKTLGLDELIAETPQEYVDLNVRLATDADWRSSFHTSLRDRLRGSPLTDVSRFAENLEAAYRTMWHEWCATQLKQAS